MTTLNQNWRFSLGDTPVAWQKDYDDSAWLPVTLPHDWAVSLPFSQECSSGTGYLPGGIGWYRCHFQLPKSAQGKKIFLNFDGAYKHSQIWVNGYNWGQHAYGYTPFQVDISDTAVFGDDDNVVSVRLSHEDIADSRWYTGSGITRKVTLEIQGKIYFEQFGVVVSTPSVSSQKATVRISSRVVNSGTSANTTIGHELKTANGEVSLSLEQTESRGALESRDIVCQADLVNPLLWSPDNAQLYTLTSKIFVDGRVVSEQTQNIGIREFRFDPNTGFFLNGKNMKLKGVCVHHDAGCLGAAVPKNVWRRRLLKLKTMGCNAIRTSHNPRSSEFMDLCDELGFLVMNELFDEWTFSKGQTTSAYHVYFKDNWEKDAANFIRRDRNHPSVVLWSAGNEVRDQLYPEGVEVLRKLLNLFHTEDPTRPVTQGNDQIAGEAPWPALPEFLDRLDIVGYNYVGRWRDRAELYYTVDKIAHPNWKMIGTENGAAYSDRNFSLGTDKNTVNPNYTTGMLEAEALWKYTAVHDFVIGDFMWTGIDYLGESRWPSRGSGGSPMDMAGFTKSNYYFYQSLWTEKPMVHILPHWNWKGREGQVIPVLVYSNCDAVELFVNGKSFGEQRLNFPRYGMAGGWGKRDRPFVMATTNELHLSWTVPYQPGEVKAVGKIQGKVVFTETIQTTDKPAALRVTSDKKTIRPNGEDIAHIKVEIVDSKGNLVPTANNEIRFSVKGEGQLIGAESGDNRSHNSGHFKNLDSSQVAAKEAYCGLILGYVQAAEKAGNITVEVSSQGLKGAVVNLSSR
jgi:beta-galactosidase